MTIFSTFKEKLFFNKGIDSGCSNKEEGCCFKGRYNEKWDRILATVTAVLTFALLLTYVIFSTVNERYVSENTGGNQTAPDFRNNTDEGDGGGSSSRELEGLKCEIQKFCAVTCSDFVLGDNISEHVNEATKNATCPALHPLKIGNSLFINDTIKEGWLRPLTHLVSYLVLTTSNITEIGSKAFAGHPFNYLKILEMEDLRLRSLLNASFVGATIETLSITYSVQHTFPIERRAFDGIRSTLTTLNMKHCLEDGDVLSNLTGVYGTEFDKLIQIDLSYNYLTHIPNSSFVAAPKLTQLFLHNNQINHIQDRAFESYSTFSPIEKLQLSNNSLSYLDQMVFYYFSSAIQIDLSNNPWHCNCSLQWLKNWYQNNSTLNISQALFCSNHDNKTFDKIDFLCLENDGNSTMKPTSSPITSPSQDTHDYIQLHCSVGVTNFPGDYYDDWSFLPICVRISQMDLEIYEVDVNTATFEVRVSGQVENSHIMWYNTKNKSDTHCVTNVDDAFIMENLERDATYTICALYGDETTTSPYDCVGFVVPPEWDSRTWLANKMIKPIIGGLCSVLLLEAVIVGVIVFYCIRQHPKFISGNKRVVVVSTKTTDAIIMPKSYPATTANKETVVVPSTSGYLTPKYQRVNDKRQRMLRSMSESSVLSGSYINKDEIYRRRRMETTLYEMSDEEHIYECPPLPPNHPSEIRKQGGSGRLRDKTVFIRSED